MENIEAIIEKTPNWLRWILFLPLSILYASVIRYVLLIGVNFSNWFIGAGKEDGVALLGQALVEGPVFAYLLLHSCHKIVPAYKKQTVIVVSFILSMLSFATLLAIGFFTYYGVVFAITVITCIYITIKICDGNETLDK